MNTHTFRNRTKRVHFNVNCIARITVNPCSFPNFTQAQVCNENASLKREKVHRILSIMTYGYDFVHLFCLRSEAYSVVVLVGCEGQCRHAIESYHKF